LGTTVWQLDREKQIQRKDARPQGAYVATAKETKYTKKRN